MTPLPPPVQQACERLAYVCSINAADEPWQIQFHAKRKLYRVDDGDEDSRVASLISDDLETVAMHFLRAAGFLGDEKE